MTTEHIVCDLDDYCDTHSAWAVPILDHLHEVSKGRFKATLFAIPDRTHAPDTRPWLELAVHGWDHRMLECQHWTKERTLEVLRHCDGWTHLFKAPYWTASPGVYEALLEAGWAVADHPRNIAAIPRGLRRYVLSPDHTLGAPHHILPIVQAHGHFTNEVGNGLRENLGTYIALAESGRPFKFVSEVLT